MTDSNYSEISEDAMFMFGEIGLTGKKINAIKDLASDVFSYRFNQTLIEQLPVSEFTNNSEWLKEGISVQMIASGQSWKKGKIRLRVIAEFIEDEELKINEDVERSIDNSLDSFRKRS